MDINNMIPIAQYAQMIGKNPANVRQKCLRGTLPGAVKIGRDWFIARDAEYPDARITSGQYINWRTKKNGPA